MDPRPDVPPPARPCPRSLSPSRSRSPSPAWLRRLGPDLPGGLRLLMMMLALLATGTARAAGSLTLRFKAPHWLYIEGEHLPGRSIEVNYLEAYCRAGSTDADWVKHTVIPHRAELLSLSADRKV
ncbi:MAG: hypothetical protein FJ396_13690, partial [Verrucomicrobia bacterium]|nr:hypothetical protein [Verrucomicrobiota bacterium]